MQWSKTSELMNALFSKKSNLSKNKIIRPQKLQLANPAINKGRNAKKQITKWIYG